MTTDVINNRDTEKALMTSGAFFRSRLGKKIARAARNAPQKDLGGRNAPQADKTPRENTAPALDAEILSAAAASFAIEPFNFEKDGWKRCLGNTIALLEYAHRLIDAAEAHIMRQDERISAPERLSVTDELTGLKNRRGFFEAFMSEIDRADRGVSTGGLLILIDLDNFKTINDVHGHQAGDACLRLVARTIDGFVRTMDTAARLGGDEFVILLSNTSKENAAARAQTLAWQLNNLALAWYGEEVPVRASLGLRNFGAGDCADKIFNDADHQLYASKAFRSRRRAHDQAQGDNAGDDAGAEDHHDVLSLSGNQQEVEQRTD
jgi:diguanylate cyclase (GGDEF)-like protein